MGKTFWEKFSEEPFVDKFVGRDDLLAIVDEAVADAPNKHIIMFFGEGGIGKTALLRRIYNKYNNDKNLFVAKADYREAKFHSLSTFIEGFLVQLLKAGVINPDYIEEFRAKRKSYQQMWLTPEINDNQIKELERIAGNYLIQQINEKLKNRRVLALLDSIEVYLEQEGGTKPREIASQLNNNVLIFAGRPSDHTTSIFINKTLPEYKSQGWNVHKPIFLNKFTIDETRAYFAKVLPVPLPLELIETIHILTDGKPILLAFMVEWFKHNVRLPDYINKSKDELEALDEFHLDMLREDFELMLIRRVQAVRTPLEKALLFLSFLDRRYDKRILQLALDRPMEYVERLETELRSMAFVRSFLDDSSGLLHDEAKRLIYQYAWPPYDPTHEDRHELARKVIDGFYLPEIKRLRDEAAAILKAANGVPVQVPQEMRAHELEMECLDYHYRISLDEGRRYVTQLIGEGISLRKREGIRHEITMRVSEAEAKVAVARMNLRRGQFAGNQEIVEKALKEKDLEPWYRMRLLYELSDAPTDPEEKAAYLKRAKRIAHKTRDQKAEAQIHNDLGLMYRRQGLWDKAEESYRETLKILKFVDDPDQKASTLNNLAYVKLLQGDLELAVSLADIALEMRETRANQLGMAFSYLTKGQLVEANGDHVQAVRDYRMAASLFRKLGRDQNEAQAQIHLSEARRLDEDFEAAETLLSSALQLPPSEIRAHAERELGALYFTQGQKLEEPAEKASQYEAARTAFEKSLQTSQLKRDWYGQAQAFYELIFLGFTTDSTIDEAYAEQLRAVLADHDYPILKAQLAELYAEVKYKQGEIETAFKAYIQVANILSKRNLRKYNDMFARFKHKFLTQPLPIQYELSDYFEEVIAELPPQSRLRSSLSSLCRAFQLAY